MLFNIMVVLFNSKRIHQFAISSGGCSRGWFSRKSVIHSTSLAKSGYITFFFVLEYVSYNRCHCNINRSNVISSMLLAISCAYVLFVSTSGFFRRKSISEDCSASTGFALKISWGRTIPDLLVPPATDRWWESSIYCVKGSDTDCAARIPTASP
ncbi:hypothetical protein [African swine fever virus]|nr:F8221_gp146 [African swine fever virus]WMQ66063.1 hypothetical protein [African swine fever virus]WMZ41396.1 hypothetical protein [African swine fever virus]